jgi:hypothetical protein
MITSLQAGFYRKELLKNPQFFDEISGAVFGVRQLAAALW